MEEWWCRGEEVEVDDWKDDEDATMMERMVLRSSRCRRHDAAFVAAVVLVVIVVAMCLEDQWSYQWCG